MNSQPELTIVNRATSGVLGLLLVGGLFAVLSLAVKLAVAPPDVDAARGLERAKDLQEIRATEDAALAHPGWIDESRGLVRLPINKALRLTAQKWQNPGAARAELNDRAEKAAAPAAPAPPKPSSFE
jgi:hypothetical protein